MTLGRINAILTAIGGISDLTVATYTETGVILTAIAVTGDKTSGTFVTTDVAAARCGCHFFKSQNRGPILIGP